MVYSVSLSSRPGIQACFLRWGIQQTGASKSWARFALFKMYSRKQLVMTVPSFYNVTFQKINLLSSHEINCLGRLLLFSPREFTPTSILLHAPTAILKSILKKGKHSFTPDKIIPLHRNKRLKEWEKMSTKKGEHGYRPLTWEISIPVCDFLAF